MVSLPSLEGPVSPQTGTKSSSAPGIQPEIQPGSQPSNSGQYNLGDIEEGEGDMGN